MSEARDDTYIAFLHSAGEWVPGAADLTRAALDFGYTAALRRVDVLLRDIATREDFLDQLTAVLDDELGLPNEWRDPPEERPYIPLQLAPDDLPEEETQP